MCRGWGTQTATLTLHHHHHPMSWHTVGLGDSLSFGLLIGVLLCMFGTWGHFMFGSQADDWHTSGLSIPSVIRFMM